jgi:hypothetical protein
MGLFLSNGCYWVFLPVLCSERERPFFVPSPAILVQLRQHAGSHTTLPGGWREMDSVLRRSQTTQKTQRFRHSRCGDKKVLSPVLFPSRDLRLPRIEIEDLSRPRYGVSTWTICTHLDSRDGSQERRRVSPHFPHLRMFHVSDCCLRRRSIM